METLLDEKNFYLKNYLGADSLDASEIIDTYLAYGEKLLAHVKNISVVIYNGMKSGKNVLFEGAQGTHLDIEHGMGVYLDSTFLFDISC